MKNFRAKIETIFERQTGWIFRNRFKTLFLMFMLIGYLGSNISNISIDTSTEEMLHSKDPSRIEYNNFKDQFGNSEFSIIMIESPEIFTPAFLTKLKALHQELEVNVPHLHEITSLLNIRNTRGDGDTLLVDDLLKDWPERSYNLSEIKKIAEKNEFYLNNFLSRDGRYTTIIVETRAEISDSLGENDNLDEFGDDFDENAAEKQATSGPTKMLPSLSPSENALIKDTISLLIKKYQTPDFIVKYTGGPVIVDAFNRGTDENMKRFALLTTLAIIIFLVALFRRTTGVFLPIFVVASSTISTMGIMVLSGTAISSMTQVIPAFLTAVGVADSIHVLAIFYRSYQEGKTKEEAICYAMGHSGFAIAMTSVTTAASLLSFSLAEIATIADMGIFASVGVMLALLYTIILLPALIAIVPVKLKPIEKEKKKSIVMDKVLLFFANLSTTHPVKIIVICIMLSAVSVYYITELKFASNIVNYFPDDHPAKIDLKAIEKQLNGTLAIEVIIDTQKEDGIHDPAILNGIEKLSKKIIQIQNEELHIGKVTSIVDIVKETNQALHGNDENYYKIPQEKKVVSQVLFMFENSGSDDLEKISDNQFRKTRVTIKTKWADSVVYKYFVKDLETMFEKEFNGKAKITVTGISALLARTIPAAMDSMMESYFIALCVITIFMLILVGDLKLGLLSMAPNLLPIIMVMGLLRICGLDLDINTLFIGSIAIGLVVDDTIHFMYNFRKYYKVTGDSKKAIEETLLGTGRALLITSIVLCANFFTLMTGSLNNTRIFGLFTGLVIIFALLADFILAPALMTLATRKKNPTAVDNFQPKIYDNDRLAG